MKKFFSILLLYFVLSLGVFSFVAPRFLYPPKAEALFGEVVFDPAAFQQMLQNLANDAKSYALEVKKYEQMVRDYVEFAQQTKKLIESTKTLSGIACYAEEQLGVNVRNILGNYGLAPLTETADKIIRGAGVKDLLCDAVGGCIGFGGVLQGGLSGFLSREDMVSGVIERYGVKLPSGIAGKLTEAGILDKQNILRQFAGKSCPCVPKLSPQEQTIADDLITRGGSTAVLAETDSGVYECPDDPVAVKKPPKSCYNPNNPSIIDRVQDDAGSIRGPRMDPEEQGIQDLNTYSGSTAVLAEEDVSTQVEPESGTPPGETAIPPNGVSATETAPASGGSCKKSIPPVSAEDMSKILWTLRHFGLEVSAEQAAKMIETGVLDPEETLKKFPTPIVRPLPTVVTAALPPCGKWEPPLFKDTPNSSKDSTNGFIVHQAPPFDPNPEPVLENNKTCAEYESSIPGFDGKPLILSTNPTKLVLDIFTWLLGVVGGIALLLIMLSGYKVMTSKGKPEMIQEGRDQLTAAIVGLLFIIFSFVIYQLIVVDILRIPGIS